MTKEQSLIIYVYSLRVLERIREKYVLDESVALRRFLYSETYRMLSDPKLLMWEYTPEDIFELWECEQINGSPRNSTLITGEALS